MTFRPKSVEDLIKRYWVKDEEHRWDVQVAEITFLCILP